MMFVGFSRPIKFRLFSWLTMKFERVNFSHIYIRFYDKYLCRWIVLEASHGEVHFESFENWSQKNERVHEFFIKSNPAFVRSIYLFGLDRLQRPYGFLQILIIAIKQLTGLKLITDGEKSYICSELVAQALRIEFDKPLDFVTPKDIYERLI